MQLNDKYHNGEKLNMAVSSEDSMLFNVEKLTTDNYHAWKYSMKLHLIRKGLWDIVSGDETLEARADENTKKNFNKRANLAITAVGLNVTKGLQIYTIRENCKGCVGQFSCQI